MATFRIPPVLRPLTGDQVQIDADGATLRDALDELFGEYPELRDRLIGSDGEIRRFVNVYVDDEDVRTRSGLGTQLEPGSEVIVLPAMAGG